MKTPAFSPWNFTLLALAAGWMLLPGCATAADPGKWRMLFDGTNTSAWREFGQQEFPKQGWEVKDGCLHLLKGEKGGQLVTRDEFENYEFEWEWRINPRGNNGVKYLVTEKRMSTPGPEYQMVDDTTTKDPKFQTASFYEVLAPKQPSPVRPPGEWNKSRIVIRGNHVEHWLNDEQVLAYELGSEEVKAGIAKSKFRNVAGFDQKVRGRILLTNHDSETWYRNIRIRELPAP